MDAIRPSVVALGWLLLVGSTRTVSGQSEPTGVPAQIAAGYAAKMICSTAFVSRRDVRGALIEDLKRAAPVAFRIDTAGRSVVAWAGPASRRAIWQDGLGCVLRTDSLVAAPIPYQVIRWEAPSDALWPDGERIDTVSLPAGIDRNKLQAAVDFAFAEPGPTNPKKTRAIVVAWNGRIVAERYAPGFDASTPQLGWSMTKSVINALAGILVGRGLLDPMKPVLAPEWRAAGDPRAAIRLDDLLRMSSGLRFDETYGGAVSDVAQDLFVVGDAGHYAAALPLDFPIGTRWSYASGSTNIVAREIRRALGDDAAYLALPRTALFGPLGMRTAVLEPDASGTFVGSSFMYASARDWARFAQLYLDDGVWRGKRILPEGWVKYSARPSPADTSGIYGAAVWINVGDRNGKRPYPHVPADAFFFRGHDRQDIAVIPSKGLVAVRLGYTPGREWDLDGFLERVIDALPR